jgi:hypothetical protein
LLVPSAAPSTAWSAMREAGRSPLPLPWSEHRLSGDH